MLNKKEKILKHVTTITKTFISTTFWICVTSIFVVLAIPFTLFPQKNRYDLKLYFVLSQLCSRLMVWGSFIKYQVEGTENLSMDNASPAIIVVNHTSSLDIPFVEMLLNAYPHIWISKQEYAQIPIGGIVLQRMNILIQKNNVRSILHCLRQINRLIYNKKRHLVIFPEGTRHSDGNVHEFFQGFAMIAQKLNRPVIPIAIYGLHKIYPKHKMIIDSSACTVKISVGKPMFFNKQATRKNILETTHAWFQKEIKRITPHP